MSKSVQKKLGRRYMDYLEAREAHSSLQAVPIVVASRATESIGLLSGENLSAQLLLEIDAFKLELRALKRLQKAVAALGASKPNGKANSKRIKKAKPDGQSKGSAGNLLDIQPAGTASKKAGRPRVSQAAR
ncbi:hypothetical protein NK718_02380 [Alsobacter sp. SYSU M60028]|uniref:Uncharacterized protein n=1 Tax=Alsobacter ponti TaxID=2962936 RepID=A0ABT1L7A7_9HYPH|nr:hypothetical protein [Alsobacter ponti]MCP8937350.1 hypothetical protein [Alsobacter ponti]